MSEVILAGAGCGGRDLLTLGTLEVIRQAEVIVHDDLISQEILSIPTQARWISVGKRKGRHSSSQEEINDLLIRLAGEYDHVLRLKGGDPFVFGRGMEEVRALREAGISCRVLPGITSAIAVPERFQIPVTDRSHASSFTVITASRKAQGTPFGNDVKTIARLPGTLVVLMGLSRLPEIARDLMEAGKDPETPVAVLSSPDIRHSRMVTGTLQNIAALAGELPAPAVIVIGDVVREAQTQPVFTVGTTFTRDLTARVARDLEPGIELQPVLEPVMERQERLDPKDLETDWIVLTSRTGVHCFLEDLKAGRLDLRRVARIAVVGSGTAEALAEAGLYPDLQPEKATTESLTEALLAQAEEGSRILLLRSAQADDLMDRRLEDRFRVQRRNLYTHQYRRQDGLQPDLLVFASRAAVRAWKETFSVPVLCLSEVTARAVRERDPQARILMAPEISAKGLARAIRDLAETAKTDGSGTA